MLSKTHIAIALTAACLISPPAFADREKDESGDGKRHEQKYEGDKKDRDDRGDRREWRGKEDDRYGERGDRRARRHDDDRHSSQGVWPHKRKDHGGHAQVKVPPGHLPPPGECRIWFPDRPPGHQPPPGDCRELSRHVPRGAVLVEGG